MLVKDPYAHPSNQKIPSFPERPFVPSRPRSFTGSLGHVPAPPIQEKQNRDIFRQRMLAYERQIGELRRSLEEKEVASREILGYQQINYDYHEEMKLKNYELNRRLSELAHENKLRMIREDEEQQKYIGERDSLLHKYQEQTEQTLGLKRQINLLLQQKAKQEEEISHLRFLFEKESSHEGLELREALIRMENLERTFMSVVATKDQEIMHLQSRLRVYEDQNRRLNQFNKTLQLTKAERIDNLSQIHHLDSNVKENTGREKQNVRRDKENAQINVRAQEYPRSNTKFPAAKLGPLIRTENQNFFLVDDPNHQAKKQIEARLEKEKAANENLRKQIQRLKQINLSPLRKNQNEDCNKSTPEMSLNTKSEGLIESLLLVRQGISEQIFDTFFKSVKDGDKKQKNSLIIFIDNWNKLNCDRIKPYISSYFQSRESLKELAALPNIEQSMRDKLQDCIPMNITGKGARSNVSDWVLSTIQFTKSQREKSKQSLNNDLLFLFRLLTIEYRLRYPLQGKSPMIDKDVRNELSHSIVKGVHYVLKNK